MHGIDWAEAGADKASDVCPECLERERWKYLEPPVVILAPSETIEEWTGRQAVYLEARAKWLQAERLVGWEACLRVVESGRKAAGATTEMNNANQDDASRILDLPRALAIEVVAGLIELANVAPGAGEGYRVMLYSRGAVLQPRAHPDDECLVGYSQQALTKIAAIVRGGDRSGSIEP